MKIQLNQVEQQAFLQALIDEHIRRIIGPNTSSTGYTRLNFIGTIQLGAEKLPKHIGLEELKTDYVPIPATLTEKKLAVLIEIYNTVSKKYHSGIASMDMLNLFTEVKQTLLKKYSVFKTVADIDRVMQTHRSDARDGCTVGLTIFFTNPKSTGFLVEYGFFQTENPSSRMLYKNPSYGTN